MFPIIPAQVLAESPKTALSMFMLALGIAGFVVYEDATAPDPPPPAPWTAQERAMITKCAESWSAGWCADNVLRLREVLQ